jgi:hypothetical protein
VTRTVAIIGAGTEGLRLWEALTRCGNVDVVAFVDADVRLQGRMRAGLPIHPPRWLESFTGDVVAGCADRQTDADSLPRHLVTTSPVACLPTHLDDEALARAAATKYPDPLATLLAAPSACACTSVGIFGTGAAAAKVWEAVNDVDVLEPVWFADNDVRRQGREFLWLPVIAPSAIPSHRAAFVIIGSMSRGPILQQLLGLGVSPARILSPDVCAGVATIRTELCHLLAASGAREVLV